MSLTAASWRRATVRYGVNITHEQIIVTTGGSEAVLFAFMSCLNPGEEVITFEPFYANYNGFAIELPELPLSRSDLILRMTLPCHPSVRSKKKITHKDQGHTHMQSQ
ncbi:MAG: aminotransferase class I/II-fold pyridoxal phosphate-dependent enzyme [Desulfobacterales bacterium]|nr:aminotransferase class I/II-fold pyridoxal phosphate-dependent enzyme [Desulfobacterales bacterium]